MLLDPDADEAAANIMTTAQGLERLSVQADFNHLAFLGNAVSSVSLGHGTTLQKASDGGNLNRQIVQPQRRTTNPGSVLNWT